MEDGEKGAWERDAMKMQYGMVLKGEVDLS
jgi:hypothetical protein